MHERYAFLVSLLLAASVAARGEGEGAQGGLAGWWGFDKARGTIARDSSGNGNDISLTGCAGLGWNKGVVGRSLAFGRKSRGPRMRVGDRLQPAGELWSASVWIKTAQPSGTVFFAGVPRGDRWAIRVRGGRAVFEVSMGQAEGWRARSARSVADGEWHHLVGVRTATRRIALYVDGALQETVDTTGGSVIRVGEATFTLGSFAGEDPFVGFIDELSMHRQAFTAREVRDLTASILRKARAAPGREEAGPGPVTAGASPGPGGPPPTPASIPGKASIEELFAAVGETPVAPPGLAASEEKTPAGDEPASEQPDNEAVTAKLVEAMVMFEELIARRDYSRARHLALAMADDPASAAIAAHMRAASRVAQSLIERQEGIREALQRQIGGDIQIETEAGKRSGKLLGVSDNGMEMASEIKMHGRVLGNTKFTVSWRQLAYVQEEQLAGAWVSDADGKIARSFLALAAADIESARNALAEAGNHLLLAHLTSRVESLVARRPARKAVKPRGLVYRFTQKQDLDNFTTSGSVRIHERGGLELNGVRRRRASAISKREFADCPIHVVVDAECLQRGVLDIIPCIFSRKEKDGITVHLGSAYNTRSSVYVFGKAHNIVHTPLTAGTRYTIEILIDGQRTLTVSVNGAIVHTSSIPPQHTLQGPIMLSGGVGHVIYKSVVLRRP